MTKEEKRQHRNKLQNKYYLKNKDKLNNKAREKNRKYPELMKGYRLKRREQDRINRNIWAKKNRSLLTYYQHRHRLLKKQIGGSHTLSEWETLKAQYNWTCVPCKRQEPEIKLTEDHIIPTSQGGSDNIENIQPLCRNCNSSKYTKIIRYERT